MTIASKTIVAGIALATFAAASNADALPGALTTTPPADVVFTGPVGLASDLANALSVEFTTVEAGVIEARFSTTGFGLMSGLTISTNHDTVMSVSIAEQVGVSYDVWSARDDADTVFGAVNTGAAGQDFVLRSATGDRLDGALDQFVLRFVTTRGASLADVIDSIENGSTRLTAMVGRDGTDGDEFALTAETRSAPIAAVPAPAAAAFGLVGLAGLAARRRR